VATIDRESRNAVDPRAGPVEKRSRRLTFATGEELLRQANKPLATGKNGCA